jgi:hypothetical protein
MSPPSCADYQYLARHHHLTMYFVYNVFAIFLTRDQRRTLIPLIICVNVIAAVVKRVQLLNSDDHVVEAGFNGA